MTRLRLGLEGAYLFTPSRGVSLTPSLKLALRRDDGDAESGFGIDIGGGLGWADSGSGLSADVRARGVVLHQASGFRDWQVSGRLSYDPRPASPLGPSLAVAASRGRRSDSLAGVAGGAAGANAVEGGHVDAELGYGFPVLDGRLVGTPHIGLQHSGDGREYRLGFDLDLAPRAGSAVTLGAAARRREGSDNRTGPEHELWLGASARW